MYSVKSRGLVQKELTELKQLKERFADFYEAAGLTDLTPDFSELQTAVDGKRASDDEVAEDVSKKREKWNRRFK